MNILCAKGRVKVAAWLRLPDSLGPYVEICVSVFIFVRLISWCDVCGCEKETGGFSFESLVDSRQGQAQAILSRIVSHLNQTSASASLHSEASLLYNYYFDTFP